MIYFYYKINNTNEVYLEINNTTVNNNTKEYRKQFIIIQLEC